MMTIECRLCHRIGTRGFSPWGSEGWECSNDRACRSRREARGLEDGRVVIHRKQRSPLGSPMRWLIDPVGERYWLLDNGPGWGWEILDDSGNAVPDSDGLLSLDEVRRWAISVPHPS